ncbi:MAG: BamA/TamA family outer membrane protein [Bryobacterales bacterium]|nr:BamA/TamA family outer membrane protein [Bryobacterales bacterium]MBV9398051.1 BamA/TamA family outer membrane protein [Bryobacterales bacterium]
MQKLSLLAVTVAVGATLIAKPGDQGSSVESTNVNARYTVESVSLAGSSSSAWKSRISTSLRSDLDRVIGEKLDHPYLEQLAARMKRELRVSNVAVRVTKGNAPDSVSVIFEVTPGHEQKFDIDVAKFLYHSDEGWSGEADITTRAAGNTFRFGVVSDSDSLVERFSGVRAKFERASLGTNRLGLSFEFDTFHNQWNPASAAAQPESPLDLYNDRQDYSPQLTLVLAQPLDWHFGVHFSRFRLSTPASRTESSNGVVSTLRYHPRWGSADDPRHPDDPEQELDASYSLESATRELGSDSVYTRHQIRARYRLHHLHNLVEIGFLAGKITGVAPLFNRFVLGNSSTLRGWNKYELDPLGGSRVMHGSIDYNYRFVQVFYDAGAIWDRRQDRGPKQSAGVGLRKDNFQLAVAFPLRAGRCEPVFFAGMNF